MDHLSVLVNPAIQSGAPIIAGTRVPIEALSVLVWSGLTLDDINNIYPRICANAVLNACWFQGTLGPTEWKIRWGKWANDNFVVLSNEDIDHIALPPNRFETPMPKQILSNLALRLGRKT